MSDNVAILTRRTFIQRVPLGVAGTIMFAPTPTDARFFGILFRVASFGFGSVLGAGLALGAVALGTAAAGYGLYSAFRESFSRGGGSYGGTTMYAYHPDGWKRQVPPKPIVIKVSFEDEQRIKGDVLRLRALEHDILKNDGIALPCGGRLIIEEDGIMRFVDTPFRGYACVQQDGVLSAWTNENHLVMTRAPRRSTFHCVHHDSNEGRSAMASLLGDVRHA